VPPPPESRQNHALNSRCPLAVYYLTSPIFWPAYRTTEEALDANVMVVQGLCVSSRCRRKGFGAALMAGIESLASATFHGPLHVYLSTVGVDNISFYRGQCGYLEITANECAMLPRGFVTTLSSSTASSRRPSDTIHSKMERMQVTWFYKMIP
jgi:hypothetical protein